MIFGKKKRIYFDNASATKLDKRVLKEMRKAEQFFANPSSIHTDGIRVFEILEKTRRGVAENLRALPDEIFFTSGATESNNLVIQGLSEYLAKTGREIENQNFISTKIDHPSVLEPLKHLEQKGAQVEFLSVNGNGFLDLKEFAEKINDKTVLISLSLANSEIGVINDIREVMKIVRRFRKLNQTVFPYVHLDATQGFLLDLDVQKLGVDFLVLDGQKMYGPKGSGILYKRRGVSLSPIFYGGHQENGLRAGTENVVSAVGFATALNLAIKNRRTEFERISELRNYLFNEIKKVFPGVILNGPEFGEGRLPGNLNISLPGHDRELVVLRLDAKGISISAGSACQKSEESYVLQAITDDNGRISSAIRISLGRFNKKAEIKKFIKIFKKILKI